MATPVKSTYAYDEAIKATREYFGGDDLAAKVWASKYALKDSFGNLYEKTPDDMHRRLAAEIYRIEQKYPNPLPAEVIYEAFKDFKYIIPQGGPMTGIGNDYQIASLSNCFVIGNKGDSDSYGGIMKIDQEQVQLMKRRGGVGHDLSHITSQRFTGAQQRPHLHGCGALHGALFKLNPRGGTGRTQGSTDALHFHQAP
ncbi:MAG: hypothetical protein MZV63_50560 [Marinilabiliales bacterium]|nr:hypothetical protein [Marinilabiliales bacterium]